MSGPKLLRLDSATMQKTTPYASDVRQHAHQQRQDAHAEMLRSIERVEAILRGALADIERWRGDPAPAPAEASTEPADDTEPPPRAA